MRHQTALGRVKGLGSARSGSRQWVAQKVSAVVLAVLFLWFAFSFARLYGQGFEAAIAWIGKPFNTVLAVTFVFTAFYHAILGLQVVIEDYVAKTCVRIVALNAMRVILSIVGLAVVWAILRAALY